MVGSELYGEFGVSGDVYSLDFHTSSSGFSLFTVMRWNYQSTTSWTAHFNVVGFLFMPQAYRVTLTKSGNYIFPSSRDHHARFAPSHTQSTRYRRLAKWANRISSWSMNATSDHSPSAPVHTASNTSHPDFRTIKTTQLTIQPTLKTTMPSRSPDAMPSSAISSTPSSISSTGPQTAGPSTRRTRPLRS